MFDRYVSRLKISLCILLFSLFSVFIYTPATCYLGNMDELQFSFWLFGKFLVILFLCGLVGSFIVAMTEKKVYLVLASVLFSFGLCAYLQANYLNPVIREFSGAEMDWTVFSPGLVVNTVFWIVVPVVMIILALRWKKVWKNIVIAISCLIFATQVVSLGIVTIMTFVNGETYSEKLVVTKDGRLDYSADEMNIVYLVLDNVDSAILFDIAEEQPELLMGFEGFTWYQNYAGMYSRSYPSVQQLLTSAEYQWDQSMPSFNRQAYLNPLLLRALKDKGFFVHYNCNTYGVSTEAMSYIDNLARAEITNAFEASYDITKQMVKYSLFMAAPHCLKKPLFEDLLFTSQSLNEAVQYRYAGEFYSNFAFYDAVNEEGLTTQAQSPTFHYYHLEGAHSTRYTADMQVCKDGEGSFKESTIYSLKMAQTYIDALKENGLYDNTAIFILSDHGNYVGRIGYPLEEPDNPILLYKPVNSMVGFDHSDVPAWQADLAPTLLQALNVDYEGKGIALPDLADGMERERYLMYSNIWREGKSYVLRYDIGANANDFSNWSETGAIERDSHYW